MAVVTSSPRPHGSVVDLAFDEIRVGLESRDFSVEELVAASIARAYETEHLRAWTYIDESGALASARERDKEMRNGSIRSALHGIPVGFKDSIAVAGMPFEAGCDVFRGVTATRDSVVASKLRAAGAIPIGINVMHSLGLGDAVAHGHLATSRHPWNDDYVPSGSSCGSAVATAARSCVLSVGGDTGGSVRGPAASCGVIGFKPSWGLFDSRGTTAAAWSMDTLGLFGRSLSTIGAAAAVLGVEGEGEERRRPLRVGVWPTGSLTGISSEIDEIYQDAIDRIRDAGLLVVNLDPVDFERVPQAWQARLAEMAPVFGREGAIMPDRIPQSMRTVFENAGKVSREDYAQSWQYGADLTARLDAVLAEVDVIMLPATPRRTLTWGSWTGSGVAGSDVYSWYDYLLPFNITGHPALTTPWRLLDGSVPSSVQFVGRRGGDAELLKACGQVAEVSPWEDSLPLRVFAN